MRDISSLTKEEINEFLNVVIGIDKYSLLNIKHDEDGDGKSVIIEFKRVNDDDDDWYDTFEMYQNELHVFYLTGEIDNIDLIYQDFLWSKGFKERRFIIK